MLCIWRCDCALCVIGNEFPFRQPHNPSATLSRGPSRCPKDKNRSPFHGEKTPDGKKFLGRRLNQISQMITAPKSLFSTFSALSIIRIHIKRLIHNDLGGREVSRPYHSPATLAKPNFRKTSPKSHIFVDFGEVLIGLMRFICIFVRLT